MGRRRRRREEEAALLLRFDGVLHLIKKPGKESAQHLSHAGSLLMPPLHSPQCCIHLFLQVAEVKLLE